MIPMAPVVVPTTPTGRILYKIPSPDTFTAEMEKNYQDVFVALLDESIETSTVASSDTTATAVNNATVPVADPTTNAEEGHDTAIHTCSDDDISCLASTLFSAITKRLLDCIKGMAWSAFEGLKTGFCIVASFIYAAIVTFFQAIWTVVVFLFRHLGSTRVK